MFLLQMLLKVTPRKKLFFISAIFIFVSACTFKALYNQLDNIIPSYIENMVSLDEALEKNIEKRLQHLLNWHRSTQLKEYADWLRIVQQDVNAQLTEKKLYHHVIQAETFWKLLLQKLYKELAEILPSLNSEQRKELFANLAEKNQDFKDDYIEIDQKQRFDEYSERMLDHYTSWFGGLSERQQAAIQQAAKEIRSVAPLRLQQRQLWQKEIQEILDSKEPDSVMTERLGAMFSDFEIKKNVEIKNLEAVNRRIIVKLTLKIILGLTPAQKEHFISQTNHYIQILTELSENRQGA